MRWLRLTLFLSLISAAQTQAPAQPTASDGRLLSMDSGEPIDHFTLGLQRTALPVWNGLALDTSLEGDVGLALNVGVRWAKAFGAQHAAVGARYTQLVGASVYSGVVSALDPLVKSFMPSLSGPSVYAAYGIELGLVTLSAEGRYEHLSDNAASVTGAFAFSLGAGWSVVIEAGYRFFGPSPLHLAAGFQRVGTNLGITLGATYVGYQDPQLPPIPVLPALDVFWSFR